MSDADHADVTYRRWEWNSGHGAMALPSDKWLPLLMCGEVISHTDTNVCIFCQSVDHWGFRLLNALLLSTSVMACGRLVPSFPFTQPATHCWLKNRESKQIISLCIYVPKAYLMAWCPWRQSIEAQEITAMKIAASGVGTQKGTGETFHMN